jgi:hypothetical protein
MPMEERVDPQLLYNTLVTACLEITYTYARIIGSI